MKMKSITLTVVTIAALSAIGATHANSFLESIRPQLAVGKITKASGEPVKVVKDDSSEILTKVKYMQNADVVSLEKVAKVDAKTFQVFVDDASGVGDRPRIKFDEFTISEAGAQRLDVYDKLLSSNNSFHLPVYSANSIGASREGLEKIRKHIAEGGSFAIQGTSSSPYLEESINVSNKRMEAMKRALLKAGVDESRIKLVPLNEKPKTNEAGVLIALFHQSQKA